MDPALERFLSPQRLAPYHLPGETAAMAFARYQWNIRLAEAMLPTLNYLEIGLRNSLDRMIAALYGADWLLSPPHKLRLPAADIRNIDNLKADIETDKGYPPRHADIVAGMSLGFWVAFFHKRYVPGLWSRGKNPLADAFPNMEIRLRNRKLVFTRLRIVKSLRNRIAHHEPIWAITPTADAVHATCREIIHAMSAEAAQALDGIDRFRQVYAAGPEARHAA